MRFLMIHLWGEALTTGAGVFLVIALVLALSFEFVNGFHDTANAVATVIYTHSLRPWIAVIWSGCWNLIGVLFSTGAVAYGVIALLPVELVIHVGSGAGFAMVFALLLSAIVWNLGTWYLGLPASSSHTLFGSIMGVGLANSLLSKGHAFGEGVNWAQAEKIGLSLVISPLVGFFCAGALLLLAKLLIHKPELFEPAKPNTPPPLWIRVLLIGTCTGVSYAHGSNDGQKGMGLIMLILIGVVPGAFALRMNSDASVVQHLIADNQRVIAVLDQAGHRTVATTAEASEAVSSFLRTTGKADDRTVPALDVVAHDVAQRLAPVETFGKLEATTRKDLRTEFYLESSGLAKLVSSGAISLSAEDKTAISHLQADLDSATKYIPIWVKVAVAIALGLGTMIGWKRIVVTVGEKIGKTHLTYAQGASAEVVAMATILAADNFGLPVSTTHVLSSGVAGTMAANRSGLQTKTLRNLLLAWVLTLPVCIFLGAVLFAAGLFIVFNVLGLR
jgi:PiT family inorganic phosphate transporter